MKIDHLSTVWNTDKILDDLSDLGFSVLDHAYNENYIKNLRHECLTNLKCFRDAAIQNGVMNNIRSDHILWIDQQFPIARQHLGALHALSKTINRHLYLGIKSIEAHFACYNSGEFYALHRDNPQGKNHRILSTVFYLHETWDESHGGQLHLQDRNKNWHIILPLPNRIVIFQSDLLHEVLISKQQRLSITAWMRSDEA